MWRVEGVLHYAVDELVPIYALRTTCFNDDEMNLRKIVPAEPCDITTDSLIGLAGYCA
jgi:hypothetical protein